MVVRRHLENRLERALTTSRVVIVEGARAVGKSTTVQAMRDAGKLTSYQSLADPTTRAAAASNLEGWLASLPTPAAIDEAQLVPGLTLAVKELTDERGHAAQFLLTGSAALDRSELGGTDPLVRRAARFRMDPLTMSEIEGTAFGLGSLVDELFDGEPDVTWMGSLTPSRLVDAVRRGGFPTISLPGAPLGADAIHAQVISDIRGTLSDHVLDDERFDRYRAEEILRALITLPSNIVNFSAVANSLGIDRRTVDRYVAVLERRFLVRRLPNLAARPQAQDKTRDKVHPVDSSFSVAALAAAGRDLESHRELLGAVLESHVVNQFLAHREWASVECSAFYWREPTSRREVDLVLRDARGRNLGIEVKAASNVNSADFGGLRALREKSGLHRGFIVYTGDRIVSFGDDLWALPFAALAEPDAFVAQSPPRAGNAMPPTADAAPPLARVFLSYSHADDEFFDGRVVSFARDLIDAYRIYYGDDLTLFTDRQLSWGSDWTARLKSELGSTDFLLAVVSPQYMRSDSCRDELLEFTAAAKSIGEPRRLLSLIWIEPPGFGSADANDPVIRTIKESQYLEGTHLRDLERGTPGYRKALEQLAGALHQTITERADRTGATPARTDDADAFDRIARFEVLREPLEKAVGEYGAAFRELTDTLTAHPPPTGNPAAMSHYFLRLGTVMTAPTERLNAASRMLTKVWAEVDDVLTGIVAVLTQFPGETRATMHDQLTSLERQLELPGIEEIGSQLQLMSLMSRHMRPLSEAMRGALDTLIRIRTSAGAWARALS